MKHEGFRAAVAVAIVAAGVSAATAQTASPIVVNAGGSLQAALNQAQPGQVIEVQAGATFDGNFILPVKTGTGYITVRTSTPDAQLPDATTRIDPPRESLLPTLRSLNTIPALRTAAGARHWRLIGLRFTTTGGGDIITLGEGEQRDAALVPSDLILDRVIVRGDATKGQKRGIALNSADTRIVNSYIAGIRLAGQEGQGIACWNGPGPFVIENNYIEAAAIGVLIGGAPPSIDQLVPGNIVIRRNHITRPVAWRGGAWIVKNLLELKNARNVQIDGNLIENNWEASQAGFAVVFTVRANGNAPWSTIEHVRFENNIVRHTGSAINVLGFDDTAPSRQLRDLVIRNNLFTDVSSATWGGSGIFLQLGDEPADVHVEHNTVMQTGNIISVYGGTAAAPRLVPGFRFTSNIVKHNSYGIFGNNIGTGNPAIAAYFPASVIVGNVMAGGSANLYPAGNVFPTVAELMAQFENAAADNYRLIATSSLRSLPQGVPGVDVDELQRAMTGSTGSPPSPPTGLRILN
jgi:Right handed beta helix region